MRKTGLIMVLAALIAGVAGWLLRRQEVATVFNPYTGLAEPWAPISIILMGVSAAVLILFFLLSRTISGEQASAFHGAFGGGVLGPVPLTLLGIAIAALSTQEGAETLRDWIWVIGAFLSGLCLINMALRGLRGRTVAIASVVPVLWLCLWLVFSYIDQATNPTLLGYIYYFFALAGLILGLYYLAGFAFEQGRAKALLFTSSAAAYFVGVTMGDDHSLARRGILLALALILLIYQLLFTKNLTGER